VKWVDATTKACWMRSARECATLEILATEYRWVWGATNPPGHYQLDESLAKIACLTHYMGQALHHYSHL